MPQLSYLNKQALVVFFFTPQVLGVACLEEMTGWFTGSVSQDRP